MDRRLVVAVALSALLAGCTSGGRVSPSLSASSSPTFSPSASTIPSPASNATWVTFNHDPQRTGVDPSSPPLGRVRHAWTSPKLDGAVYAQPLILGGHVLVATENDSVYSLAAGTGKVEWRTNLGEPLSGSDLPCGNIDPTGITGTPVVDAATGLLYAVAFVRPGRHDLVALDTSNGKVRFRRSIDPSGSDPLVHQQRAALTISNGRLYVAYGGLFGDCGDYHGMVAASALDGTGDLVVYRVPSHREAGIWGPSGAAVDASGDLLVSTGNSSSVADFDFGNAVIRLSPDLKPVDWFAPTNWLDLNQGDADLGSLGPTILPDGLVFQVGKEGIGYLLRLDHLGRIGGEAFSSRVCPGPAFGATAVASSFVYVSCSGGLVALRVKAGPSFEVAWQGPGFNAGPPIVAGGAVWCMDVGAGDLYAFDATTGGQLFRAAVGESTHFTSPAAAGGQLFVAASARVMAFGGI